MLRKTLHIIFAVLLLTATTGVAVSGHYCGETLVSVSLYSDAKECCDDISDDCCKNAFEYFQLDQEFLITVINFEIDKFPDLKSSFVELNIPGRERINSQEAAFSKSRHPITVQHNLASLQTYLL
ncbi:MAG: hypothetical protein K9J27_12195 [Bacteroidales bacterium]|nr:hypothetical protein [Bacteroidales bacterium]